MFWFPVSLKGTENTSAYDTLPQGRINHNIHSYVFTHTHTRTHTCTRHTGDAYRSAHALTVYVYKHTHTCAHMPQICMCVHARGCTHQHTHMDMCTHILPTRVSLSRCSSWSPLGPRPQRVVSLPLSCALHPAAPQSSSASASEYSLRQPHLLTALCICST